MTAGDMRGSIAWLGAGCVGTGKQSGWQNLGRAGCAKRRLEAIVYDLRSRLRAAPDCAPKLRGPSRHYVCPECV